MSDLQDLYAVLGVPPESQPEDIRQAYHVAARRLHPDINPNPGAAYQFRDITAAHQVLSDPISRQKYDTKRKQTAVEKPYFSLRVTPSKRKLPVMNEPQVLYVLVEIVPDRQLEGRSTSTPLNLTLLIDHSTSMNGIRLERTKVAAHQIIDQLSEKDVLSIVTFSDRADVFLKASPLRDKSGAKALVTTMQASGSTAMLQGMLAAVEQNRIYAGRNFVNHIIMITDGRTYGDEPACLELAERAASEGIGISAMGIGDEWNDTFLDQLASRTGGISEYITSPNAVVRFLNERVRSLGKALAERVQVSLAPDPDIKIELAFRLTPNPQPVLLDVDPVPIGQLQVQQNTSLLLQLQMPALMIAGFRSLMRIEVAGDIMWDSRPNCCVIADTSIEVVPSPPPEEPPLSIIDALGKLTLYRMQQKAEEAARRGDVREATRRLENLATRLLEAGHDDLAHAAITEAQRVSSTSMLSDEGQKRLKYGTRMLMLPAPKDSNS